MEMNKDELINRLYRLDEDADLMFDDNGRFILVIVGGGAWILEGYINRATRDIDAISVTRSLMPLLEKYDINTHVKTYESYMPYNYSDRLNLLFNGKKIDFYIASLEDLVIAKLHSGEDRHRQDLLEENILKAINWDLLDKIANDRNEVYLNELNDNDYNNFISNYNEYIRRYRK